MAVKIYTKEFKEYIESIYKQESVFTSFFGELRVQDGVSESETAFTLKALDIPKATGNSYNTDPNVGMGTGTSNSTRFGEMKEVKALNVDVPYKGTYAENYGIDAFTVNDNIEEAVAETLVEVSSQVTELFNNEHAKSIEEAAGKEIKLDTLDTESVDALFGELSAYFVNIKSKGTKVAVVHPSVYNLIISSGLTTTAKNSNVNIDTEEVNMYRGFVIEQIPEEYFLDGSLVYAYIAGAGRAFTGISIVRTIDEHPDFAGVAVQAAGKYGDYIPEANKKAMVKVKLDSTPEA